ncbi:hypothetical protein DV096_19840 [Bradymonadaceae bacterium TMQ3]|nr:hypothetical protein DV096_19840 [Bradymonadaceae bacterium TMQ3]
MSSDRDDSTTELKLLTTALRPPIAELSASARATPDVIPGGTDHDSRRILEHTRSPADRIVSKRLLQALSDDSCSS